MHTDNKLVKFYIQEGKLCMEPTIHMDLTCEVLLFVESTKQLVSIAMLLICIAEIHRLKQLTSE